MPSPGKTKARGYGAAHKRLRAVWARKVAAGDVWCARCGKPIRPGDAWDLGHDDVDRSAYTGPECRSCNRATAGRYPRKRTRRKRPVSTLKAKPPGWYDTAGGGPYSRQWFEDYVWFGPGEPR